MEQDDDVVTVKSILLFVMLILTAVAVVLPIGVMRIRRVKEGNPSRRKFILSMLNCFGGGIFVATGFLHLLPEVVENMDTAFDELLSGDQDYPFAYFVVCIGFLMVLIIEHVVLSCEKNQLKVEVNEASCRCETVIRSGLPGVTASGIFSQSPITIEDKPHRSKASHPSMAESTYDNTVRSSSPPSNISHADISDHHQERIRIVEDDNRMITYSGDSRSYSQSQVMAVKSQGTVHAFTIALALSVHSIFEGLAFGLQDTMNEVLQVYLAIIIHKVILAFSLGINFVTAQVPLKISLLLTLTFCLASPIGGAIGTVLSANDSESVALTLLNAILQGMATGTFLYIAFLEVISYEVTNIEPKYLEHRLLLVLSILIGFTTFAGLSFIHDHDHNDHNHDHDHDH